MVKAPLLTLRSDVRAFLFQLFIIIAVCSVVSGVAFNPSGKFGLEESDVYDSEAQRIEIQAVRQTEKELKWQLFGIISLLFGGGMTVYWTQYNFKRIEFYDDEIFVYFPLRIKAQARRFVFPFSALDALIFHTSGAKLYGEVILSPKDPAFQPLAYSIGRLRLSAELEGAVEKWKEKGYKVLIR